MISKDGVPIAIDGDGLATGYVLVSTGGGGVPNAIDALMEMGCHCHWWAQGAYCHWCDSVPVAHVATAIGEGWGAQCH